MKKMISRYSKALELLLEHKNEKTQPQKHKGGFHKLIIKRINKNKGQKSG